MVKFGAYHGVRVVELAEGIAGPYASRFVADQGADVIKSESATGDYYRTEPGFQVLNRNKRSVVLLDDLQSVMIEFETPLQEQTRYAVVLRNSIRDIDGMQL